MQLEVSIAYQFCNLFQAVYTLALGIVHHCVLEVSLLSIVLSLLFWLSMVTVKPLCSSSSVQRRMISVWMMLYFT